LCPQGPDRTRCRRARQSPQAEWRQSLFEHRQLEGGLTVGCAGGSCPIRNHSFRRSPQGRNARGMTTTRRLAAILAADVAGYSRPIGDDEGGTLQRLKAIRDEVIDPTPATHHGRLVKTTGDGLLVEFGSVADASM